MDLNISNNGTKHLKMKKRRSENSRLERKRNIELKKFGVAHIRLTLFGKV